MAVAWGGGHGLAATIRAVRRYAARTTAVVATADDGGSTGAAPQRSTCRARRRAPLHRGHGRRRGRPLAAALDYRFGGTDVEGHALGNLLLAGPGAHPATSWPRSTSCAGWSGSTRRRGWCRPPSTRSCCGPRRRGGRCVTGQVAIAHSVGDRAPGGRAGRGPAPPGAVARLADADQVVLGPGSLYTSVLAAAVVDDVPEAVSRRRAAGSTCATCGPRRARPGATTWPPTSRPCAATASSPTWCWPSGAPCPRRRWGPRWWRPTWPGPTGWPTTDGCSATPGSDALVR